jgi:hypothetical protein
MPSATGAGVSSFSIARPIVAFMSATTAATAVLSGGTDLGHLKGSDIPFPTAKDWTIRRCESTISGYAPRP